MTQNTALFDAIRFGEIQSQNRIVMAPLTRSRATAQENMPTALNAEYYAQRASVGLIVSEATQISQEGQGYAWTPGIFSEDHVKGWTLVTEAVHAKGGKIVCQLWHVGAISHNVFHDGAAPVSSSAWTPKGQAFVGDLLPDGPQAPHPQARALESDEIPRLLADYRHACEQAKRAGFDGVEVHGANGYLIDQFLRSSVNKREDAYGGSVENRIRLLVEAVETAIGVWGAGRVGVRLSPTGGPGGSYDDDPQVLYVAAAKALSGKGLAYLHVIRPNSHTGPESGRADDIGDLVPRMREAFGGPFIINGEFSPEEAAEWVASGRADAVAFGRLFIANPDLPARIAQDGPYNEPDQTTFYGGGAKGYTDYPTLEQAKERA